MLDRRYRDKDDTISLYLAYTTKKKPDVKEYKSLLYLYRKNALPGQFHHVPRVSYKYPRDQSYEHLIKAEESI